LGKWTEAVYQNWLFIVSPEGDWMTEDAGKDGRIKITGALNSQILRLSLSCCSGRRVIPCSTEMKSELTLSKRG
jgi:hypothetical protein